MQADVLEECRYSQSRESGGLVGSPRSEPSRASRIVQQTSQRSTFEESIVNFGSPHPILPDPVSTKKVHSRRESLQLLSPWTLPAKPWEGEDAHTIPADCLGGCLGCGDATPQASPITSKMSSEYLLSITSECPGDPPSCPRASHQSPNNIDQITNKCKKMEPFPQENTKSRPCGVRGCLWRLSTRKLIKPTKTLNLKKNVPTND